MKVIIRALEMDGHGLYVWLSFIFAAIIMLGVVVLSVRSLGKARKTLSELQGAALTGTNET